MAVFYRAKHILVEEEDDIEYLLDKLKLGTPFEDLAKEFSICDSAENGGDLGRFSSGTMLPEFEKALYHMAPGEIFGPVRTKYGLHIVYRIE